MPYRIRVTERAKQEIRRLPGHVRRRIRHLIETLAGAPVPPRSKELRGLPGRYRLPLLDWRVIYRIDDDAEVVLILTVRRKAGPGTYQDLEP